MRNEHVMLFLHHNTYAQTRQNPESIRTQNRDATIVTISAEEPFKGGYRLDATPLAKRWHSVNPARSSDWLVCSWYLQRQESCNKWWIVEWDTFARTSVREYYRPVW